MFDWLTRQENAELVCYVLLSVLALVTGLHMYFQRQFTLHLREKHPLVWLRLGSPGAQPLSNSLSRQWVVSKFFYGRVYRNLDDPVLSKKARGVWVTLVLGMVLFSSTFFVSIVYKSAHGF